MMATLEESFPFRPRFRGLAVAAMGLGAALLVAAAFTESGRGLCIGFGAAGLVFGVLYLVSPAWRLRVIVSEDRLEVRGRGGAVRFSLPWAEVVEVIASPGTRTCFVDGGRPERSLLVPGPGASASYAIAGRERLYEFICAHVSEERICPVELLEKHRPAGAGGGA